MCITQALCIFVALGIQYAMRMRHIVNSGLPRSTKCFYLISSTTRFSGGGGAIDHKMCVEFLYNFCLKYFSLYEELSEI